MLYTFVLASRQVQKPEQCHRSRRPIAAVVEILPCLGRHCCGAHSIMTALESGRRAKPSVYVRAMRDRRHNLTSHGSSRRAPNPVGLQVASRLVQLGAGGMRLDRMMETICLDLKGGIRANVGSPVRLQRARTACPFL